jgi:hypothetical protein
VSANSWFKCSVISSNRSKEQVDVVQAQDDLLASGAKKAIQAECTVVPPKSFPEPDPLASVVVRI